jgi:hypothetical protein
MHAKGVLTFSLAVDDESDHPPNVADILSTFDYRGEYCLGRSDDLGLRGRAYGAALLAPVRTGRGSFAAMTRTTLN